MNATSLHRTKWERSLALLRGHSLIVDPRGKVLAEADGTETGVIYAPIDLDLVSKVRKETFTLQNRREDIYSLCLK